MSELGRPRLHLVVTESTSGRARALASAGAPHGTLVTASEQTAGRGRQGRRWSAPAGQALLMSLVLRSPPPLLPLLAAVATCEVLGAEWLVKWPNDIVVAGSGEALAKVAGILAEGRPQEGWAVLGIGINVAVRLEELPPELHGTAATLGLEADAVEPLLGRLLAALGRRLEEPAADALAGWRERDALAGRAVTWAGGRGRAEGIDGEGRLIVALEGGGMTALDAGEVHLEAR